MLNEFSAAALRTAAAASVVVGGEVGSVVTGESVAIVLTAVALPLPKRKEPVSKSICIIVGSVVTKSYFSFAQAMGSFCCRSTFVSSLATC